MQDINAKIAQIKEKLELKINHPYLSRYIPSPIIDEDKLIFLHSMLGDLKLEEPTLDNYLVTIMLVQIALDTHDAVTVEHVNGQKLKTRQLTVLAGDYYSGLYYYILAGIDDIPFIRVLAEGIKDVNEYKIKLYQKEMDQLETLLDTLMMIESSIFRKITDFFQIPLWTELASSILLFKRLIREREQFIQADNSYAFDTLKKILLQKNNVAEYKLEKEQEKHLLFVWDHFMEHTKNTIEKLMEDQPIGNILLQKRIHTLLHPNILVSRRVEEG